MIASVAPHLTAPDQRPVRALESIDGRTVFHNEVAGAEWYAVYAYLQ